MDGLPLGATLVPVFLVFEVLQLVYAERYLGLKQIQSGIDPRQLGPGEGIAALWSFGILAELIWLVLMLQDDASRVHAACLLLVTLCGFCARSNCGLRWVLVVLTVEGALRMGLMVSLLGMAWRNA
jgi:hypothetical protein